MSILPNGSTFANVLQLNVAGRVFHSMVGAAGTGITIPIYSATSGVSFALWNPLGTNKLVVPISLQLGVAATGTPAITTLALGQVVNTGSSYATGLPIAAWTDATVYNGRVGKYGTGSGSARVGVATTTLTTAANSFYDLGFSQATTALAPGLVTMEHDFYDKVVLEPGSLVHLCGNPVAPAETFVASITWAEYDWVS